MSELKQQRILTNLGMPVERMDNAVTMRSYVQSIQALQELNRAIEMGDPVRLAQARAEAEKMIKGAGFSL